MRSRRTQVGGGSGARNRARLSDARPPATTDASKRRRGLSLRAISLGLSLLGAILAIVALAVVFANRQSPSQRAPTEPPPDLRPIDLAEAGRHPTDPSLFASGAMNWTSQNEQGEVTQEFAWQSLDPLEAGRFHVTKPKARFYLQSGETVYVQAETADVYRPGSAQTPETGTFSGGVTVKIYQGHVRSDSPSVPLLAVLQTESIDFDFRIGRLATAEEIYLTSRRIEFEGTGLDLLYNQVADRIEKLHVARGRQLLYIIEPGEERQAAVPARRTRPGSSSEDVRLIPVANTQHSPSVSAEAALVPSNEIDPREDFYRIRFGNQVSVRQHTRVIHASDLIALVHLVDGELPLEGAPTLTSRPRSAHEEAVAANYPPRAHAPSTSRDREGAVPANYLLPAHAPRTSRDRQGAVPADYPLPAHAPSTSRVAGNLSALLTALALAQVEAGSPAAASDAELPKRPSLLLPYEQRNLLRINWTGPLSVTPLSDKPAALAEDAAHILFEGRPVQLVDEHNGNEATCGKMEYFASRRFVAMHSSLAHNVTMRDRSGSVVSGPSFEISLETGLGRFVGAGTARQAARDQTAAASEALRMQWTDRLLVRFDVVSDSLRDLREAICEGEVEVDHEQFRLTSDWLRVQLDPRDDADRFEPTSFSAKGSVHGIAYGSGELRCEELVALLQSDPQGDPYLRRIEARGDVRGDDDDGRSLRAAAAELLLSPLRDEAIAESADERSESDARPKLKLERFLAWGEPGRLIEIDDGAGLRAQGLELLVEEEGSLLTMRGEPAVARREGLTIRGPELRLDERAQLLIAEGSGNLEYSAAAQQNATRDQAPEKLLARWSDRLIYDGEARVIRCLGEVSALHEPTPLEINLLDCAELTIALAADEDAGELESGPRSSGVLRLHAEGKAGMEHRRYAATDITQLERLLHIAGDRLLYDNVIERLHVPTPGRLVVADEKRYQEARRQAAAEVPTSFEVGRTLFDWEGEMTFEPNRGYFSMKRNVEMRHRERADEELFILECQALSASTTPFSLDDEQREQGGAELQRIIAEQAVYAEYGERMLVADRIDYDAIQRLLAASAVPGNTVMTVRRGDLAPMRMDLFRWNLETDKVEMEGVRPIRVPRGFTAAP